MRGISSRVDTVPIYHKGEDMWCTSGK
jgi:hypothetical protein